MPCKLPYRDPENDVGTLSPVSNFVKLEKMYLLRPVWSPVGPCGLSRWNLVDPTKIVIIHNLPPPNIVKNLRATLGHTGYYIEFIKGYVEVTAPMEKLLKKDAKFHWTESFQESLDTLKNRMATTPILIFPYWKKEFHVHVDVSSVALGMVLMQQREGSIDHPISFSRRKLSTT